MSRLRGLVVDFGGVLTNPLHGVMRDFCRAEGLEVAEIQHLHRRGQRRHLPGVPHQDPAHRLRLRCRLEGEGEADLTDRQRQQRLGGHRPIRTPVNGADPAQVLDHPRIHRGPRTTGRDQTAGQGAGGKAPGPGHEHPTQHAHPILAVAADPAATCGRGYGRPDRLRGVANVQSQHMRHI